ncbi:hypothetical protein VTL71DRAFT_10373 [Oculimacula yallundae]|uniref:2EXR domain-containing protein n=1 Tax=Oculimacula yallundae TaxID=86028 RepID=A0ABR4CT30_9HELO
MATTSQSEALTEFLVFPKLPLELKYEVFSYYLPGPRIIEIVERNLPIGGVQQGPANLNLIQSSIGCFNFPLILLSISKESRKYVQAMYRLAFENVLVHPVYINLNIDILACFSTTVWTTFSTLAQLSGDDQIEFDGIKNLALPAPTPTYNSGALVNLAIEVNANFPNLKQLFVAEPPMYWARVNATPPVPLAQAEIKDLVTLHRQLVFRGVDRGERWEASEVQIVTEGALKLRYPSAAMIRFGVAGPTMSRDILVSATPGRNRGDGDED